jgi:DNA-binding response OmpR family regulator
MFPKILIIDNLTGLPRFMAMELQAEGYQISIIDSPAKFSVNWALDHDLILLNWDLRWTAASDICRQLGLANAQAPILIATVNDKSDCYFSQEAGAQACLTKPFSMNHLLAAIEVHSRAKVCAL